MGGNGAMEDAVKRAILSMSGRLAEQITVDDLAHTAQFSKFHFTRIFRRDTGVSPGRFLSAMRMAEARRLLTTTSMKVADISQRVGYASVGTFTTRFTAGAGIPPMRYRQLRGQVPRADPSGLTRVGGATVVAVVRAFGVQSSGAAFIGLFPAGSSATHAVHSIVIEPPAPCRFTYVPPGQWFLVCAFAEAVDPVPRRADDVLSRSRFVGVHGPFEIEPDSSFAVADVRQDTLRPADPAAVGALLNVAEHRMAA